MVGKALISDCGLYRYKLYRQWGPCRMPYLDTVCWIMLNPSTADARITDPTITRCQGFSESWGYDAMWIGNVNPYRSTDPNKVPDEIPEHILSLNADYIDDMMKQCERVVIAWGTRGPKVPPIYLGETLYCLGKTLHGYPKHPLYLPSDTGLVRF